MSATLKEIIIAKEKDLLTFEVRSSAKKLKELISDDFKEIGASGAYFGLSEVLERLPTEASWCWSAQTQDWEFRFLSDDIAQTIHRAFIIHNQEDEGVYSRRMSIWRKEKGLWKMYYHQGTKIDPFTLDKSNP